MLWSVRVLEYGHSHVQLRITLQKGNSGDLAGIEVDFGRTIGELILQFVLVVLVAHVPVVDQHARDLLGTILGHAGVAGKTNQRRLVDLTRLLAGDRVFGQRVPECQTRAHPFGLFEALKFGSVLVEFGPVDGDGLAVIPCRDVFAPDGNA